MGKKCISIVVPMYNEQESLQILYRELNRVTQEMNSYDFEYLSMTDQRIPHLRKSKNLRQRMREYTIFPFRGTLEKKRRCWQDCPMQRGIM